MFLLFGVFTLVLLFTVQVAAKLDYNDVADILVGPMRMLIIPMYLVWLLLTMAQVAILGSAPPPWPLAIVVYAVHLTFGFLPYLLADYAVDLLLRKRRSR